MAAKTRKAFEEGQGTDEEIIHTVTITEWASGPITDISVVAKQMPAMDDVTSTLFPTNTPTAVSDKITLSPLLGVEEGKSYRIEIKFTAESQVLECFGIINGEL